MGQDVHPLLQVAIFRLQQYRLLTLKGAVWVCVLTKLVDHWKLQEEDIWHKSFIKKEDQHCTNNISGLAKGIKGNFPWF